MPFVTQTAILKLLTRDRRMQPEGARAELPVRFRRWLGWWVRRRDGAEMLEHSPDPRRGTASRQGSEVVAPHFLGASEATSNLRSEIQSIAHRSATVLIEGETGVGKEVTARELHACSLRAAKPFMPVDCTAFSNQLIESQLFGHVKGAFTGAVAANLGFMRCADGGTLFLDEIGELPLDVQAKLLRCIQEHTVVPVGGFKTISIDLRFIAATHRDLARMVREGSFRQDLYYRINVIRLSIRPLRERLEDIIPLASHFLQEFAQFYEEPSKVLSSAVQDALLRHDWPGNVRELRNSLERAYLFCNDRTIDIAHLPNELRGESKPSSACGPSLTVPKNSSLAAMERMLISNALQVTNGNQSETARILDVERHRLRRLIARHGLGHLLRLRNS